ncbi:hypothetical protein LTR10_010225 [Elasticomyces elasticus]|nr:hypothetical protein LTR10_010225 [Elasticomyces elasticus]KAK4972129.1 hypothetical protein LTR42_006635 [Elasticomyces elasticus]
MTTTTPTTAVPRQLHIEPAEFTEAIRAFHRTWSELEEAEGTGWRDVRVVGDSYGPPLLRITRLLDPQLRADRVAKHDIYASASGDLESEEVAADPEDDEALIRSAPPKKTTVIHDIVYSPSYRVPVLYITLPHPPPNSNIHDLLVPASHRTQLQHAGGSLGALSLTDHPITGLPAYFIHPCRTAESMAAIVSSLHVVGSRAAEGGEIGYLMQWLGLVGPSVDLTVPMKLAEALGKLQL